MTVSLRPALVLVVMALCSGLAWQVIALDTRWEAPVPVEPAAVDTIPEPSSVEAEERLEVLATLDALEEAPLFWPSRRPPPDKPAKPVESSPEQDPLKNVRLLGTFTAGGQGGVVILIEPQKGEPRVERLTIGESFQGLTLQNVSPVAVLFEDRQGERRTLPLEIERPNLHALPVN